MTDTNNGRLRELTKKLDALKSDQDRRSVQPAPAFAKAYRVGIELLVAVAVGSLIGYWLDLWLGTFPWLLVIFFFLGVAAGFLNVYKAARTMN